MYAGGSADRLTGGAGADIFQYRAVTDSTAAAPDSILDFETGVDKLDLSLMDGDSLTAGDQSFTFVGSAAFSGVAGELRAERDTDTSNWTVQADTNGDGQVDLTILLTAVGLQPLSQGDFML